jgi:CIC family chloride channel protein
MLIGAALGAAVGAVVAGMAPSGVDVAPGGYALVGMAAAVAATTHAPLMATVLGFELSGDYAIVLPLLLATAVATLLARRLERDSIYTAELRRRGITWEGSVAERLARSVRARDLMEPATAVVAAGEALDAALSRLATDRGRLLYVVGDGPLRVISLTRAKGLWAACMRGEGLPVGATAGSVATPITVVSPDDSLLEVGEKLWDVDWGELPVVDPAHPERPLGTISRRAVLGALDRELLQRDVLTTRVAASDSGGASVDYMELPDGHGAAVIAVPGWLVGAVPDLAGLRADMGVILVAVRRDTGDDALPRWLDPDAGVRLESGDCLLVIATQAELAALAQRKS